MSKIDWINDTKVKLEIHADAQDLSPIKQATLKKLQPNVSAPGFRQGKVPISKVESAVDDNILKSTFLDDALNTLVEQQIKEHSLRPLGQPQVEIKKFVPYSELEFDITIDVVGKIKLGNYKKIKVAPEKVSITAKDVDDVVKSLQKRLAEKEDVDRAAKDGDEVWIDFSGKDENGKDVQGASGKDYPLLIGSDTFIKGFEPNIIGLKVGDSKVFDVTFPEDYAHKPLASKKVTFDITVKQVKQVSEPKVDDEFAAKAGPFKSVKELKEDIKTQLTRQKEHDANHVMKDKILEKLVKESDIPMPEGLLTDQKQVLIDEFKQNLTYRGVTFEDYLNQVGLSEEEFVEREITPQAENKVKVGLALSEVASEEQLTVTPEEVEIRRKLLKGQYKDEAMQAQLDNPEAERDLASRILSEKTIDKLVEYASQ